MEASSGTGLHALLWLLIALPLAGAAVLLLGGRRTDPWGHLLATATAAGTFVVGVAAFFRLTGLDEMHRSVVNHVFSFVPVERFDVDVNLLLDPLSACFVLLITGVGLLVHIYSIGYMADDPDRRRFFAYLNLFLASMLTLVLGDNFVVLYVGWELVGLSSYLLIGFWSQRPSAATAAKKAFVTNRIGDVGLSLAIMLTFVTLGTTDFAPVFDAFRSGTVATGTATAIGLLLLLGACGKSAQVPLHVWLPDAMEGPTPASALIHAATMVTAGVYLVARAHPIFEASGTALTAATVVGATTVIVGGVIACAQDDLKKVLAYSTISQIGYMLLAVGLGPGAYAVGIFHLLTHGFFKALLFMGAGSVMHGLGGEVDMRRMGGLLREMPVTGWTFVAGWLAIIGFPLTAGFFSKDQILETAFTHGHYVVWAVGLIGAGITAFYMSRLMFMTFLGQSRVAPDVHPHESPTSMTAPLLVLAVLSLVGGAALNATHEGRLSHFLEPVFAGGTAHHANDVSPIVLTIATALVVLIGVAVAHNRYLARPVPAVAPMDVLAPVTWARRKLYFDSLYESVLMRPGQYLARALVFFDGRGVDGAVNGMAALVGGTSGRLRRIQTGFVRSYALGMFGGAVILVGALVVVRL